MAATGITKTFGRLRVLNGVSLELMKGDRYVLFGSNGTGKTTLVKILSTIMPPDTGSVSIFDKPATHGSRTIRARIGFMSHETYLYNDLTPWENLQFYGRLYSIKDADQRVKSLLKDVSLYHRAHDRVAPFSRGMKQRLSLARALLHDPDIIFLDEPYAGLDLRAQEFLSNLISSLSLQGKTFFFITHELSHGLELATRLGVLSKGRLVYEGGEGDKQDFTAIYREILGGERA